MVELDEAILNLAGAGKIDLALRKGRQLLALKERYHTGSFSEYRTYYDLFQIAVLRRDTLKEAKRYIRLAYEAIVALTNDEESPEVQHMKRLVDSPESHRNYLMT